MENGNNISQGEGKDPSSFLSDIIGNPVTVKLNSGVVYKGKSLVMIQPDLWQRTAIDKVTLTDVYRRASIGGWLHEHCVGKDSRVCQRSEAQGIR